MALTRLGPNQSINLTSNVTGTLPIANGGTNLTSGFVNGGGVTEADQWRLTSGFNSNQDPISSNLERNDDGTFGKVGTGLSVSSGIWTFPSTGVWLVRFICKGNTYDNSFYTNIYGTPNT